MAYRHNDALYKHKVRAHRLRKIAIGAVCVAVISVGIVGVDWLMNQLSNSNTVVSSEISTSVQSANVSVFRSEYFQFQATDDWVQVANLSTDKKFVYVKNKGPLVTQRLVVEVDRPLGQREADTKMTHVLPVDYSELGNFINLGEVSNHCDNSWGENVKGNPRRITHSDVSFVCSVGSGQYNIVIGEYGQDEDIAVRLQDGRDIELSIVYSDLTAYPSPGDVYNIVSSFTTL